MKERQKHREIMRQHDARLNQGGTLSCSCNARITIVRSERSGSVVTLHPFPVCEAFKQTGTGCRCTT